MIIHGLPLHLALAAFSPLSSLQKAQQEMSEGISVALGAAALVSGDLPSTELCDLQRFPCDLQRFPCAPLSCAGSFVTSARGSGSEHSLL